MKTIDRFRFSGLAALLFLSAAGTAPAATDPVLIDRIIAVVGEDVVMLSELRVETRKIEQRLKQRSVSPMPSGSAIQKQAFDTLVMDKLQVAEATRLGLQADEETISRAVSAVAANNGLTIDQLQTALAEEGMSFATFRDSLSNEILIRRLRNREVTERIQVTKSEIDSYLERSGRLGGRAAVKLRYMLVATPEGASPQQRELKRRQAESLVKRVTEGEPFGPLAQQYSNDQSGLQGGDLGWLASNSIPPTFQRHVANMQKGDVRGPIEAGRGYHILMLEDVRVSDDKKIVNQTRARHILIRTNEVTSDEDASGRLAQLRERILQGDDFNTLARANSDDTASAIKGGDLGWTTPGNLVPAFEEQMALLQPGQIGQPFKTQFGWHLVQVIDRRDYDATDETLRDQARKAVRDEKSKEALENYLRRLRDEAYIELRLDDIRR